MILFRLLLALILAVFCTSLQAQSLIGDRDLASTSRLERQHRFGLNRASHFQKARLKQIEDSLVQVLDPQWHGNQQAAIQTLRFLEQQFPTYPFAAMIEPLAKIIKNEDADPVARRLAALALDELHSDAGDAVIEEVALSCDDKGLQTLCNALQMGNKRWSEDAVGSRE